MVDAERKAQFEEDGAHFESRYFLTLLYLPPAEEAARAERFLYEGRDHESGANARETLTGFVDRTDRVLQLLEGFMPECTWLDDAETLTYPARHFAEAAFHGDHRRRCRMESDACGTGD